MRWSKVKKLVENSFADGVKGRVKVYSTHYSLCRCGRGWITVDKKELVNLCTEQSRNKYKALFHEASNVSCAVHSAVLDKDRTPNKLVEDGEFSRFDLHQACWDYLHQSIKDSLESKNPLIKSLAVLNAKVGKGRLSKLAEQNLHPLTRALLDFRFKAEKELRHKQEVDVVKFI